MVLLLFHKFVVTVFAKNKNRIRSRTPLCYRCIAQEPISSLIQKGADDISVILYSVSFTIIFIPVFTVSISLSET